MSHLLSALIILPLIGVAALLMVRGESDSAKNNVRWIALFATLITFIVSIVAWGRFDPSSAAFQLVEEGEWLSETIRFKLGVDGFSMPFILLTTFLMPLRNHSKFL